MRKHPADRLTSIMDGLASGLAHLVSDTLGVDAVVDRVEVAGIEDKTTLTVVVSWDPDDVAPEDDEDPPAPFPVDRSMAGPL